MTTTAHEDQFTADTERHIAKPYDTAAILRQNVADLERELQRQRERADIALSELEATREDNHKMMGEILGLREQHAAATARLRDQVERVTSEWERAEAELKAAREQEPYTWIVDGNSSTPLYTRPIPAPAPAVPEGDDFNGTTPHMIRCIESLVNMSDRGVLAPHGLCGHSRTLLLASANRLRQQAAPAVPGPYLLGGRRFKISINGEGGFYGFEGFPELHGQWVALVDATDNQHMQSAGENP